MKKSRTESEFERSLEEEYDEKIEDHREEFGEDSILDIDEIEGGGLFELFQDTARDADIYWEWEQDYERSWSVNIDDDEFAVWPRLMLRDRQQPLKLKTNNHWLGCGFNHNIDVREAIGISTSLRPQQERRTDFRVMSSPITDGLDDGLLVHSTTPKTCKSCWPFQSDDCLSNPCESSSSEIASIRAESGMVVIG